jgi:hypothetical protein
MEQLNRRINRRLGDTPSKTNQLPGVGPRAAERWTQQGSPTKGLAHSPRLDLWPHKISLRRTTREDQGLLSKPPEGRGEPSDQVALSQSLESLDHSVHGRL